MPPASESSSSSRKRHNVSQACINCRQRKKKCDGRMPVCGTCDTYKDECVWNSRADWRKSVSRTEANALRARVAALERQLQQANGRGGESSKQGMHGMSDSEVSSAANMPTMDAPSIQGIPSVSSNGVMDSPEETRFGMTTASPALWDDSDSRRRSEVRGTRRFSTAVEDDIEDIMVQDSRGQLRVHAQTSAFRHRSGAEPAQLTSPKASNRPARAAVRDDKRWARYLPDFHLTRAQHDTAVDRFFRYFACWAQRVTPHLFYRDMEIAVWADDNDDLHALAPNYSRLLHNYVLALGLAFSDEEHLRVLSTRRIFAAEGNRHFEHECANPCVGTVQGVAVRASFSSTMGDYSLGWVYHGVATRLCYALGLHVDTSPLVARGKLDPETAAQRVATFWTTYSQEGLWGVYIGRRPMTVDYSVPPPTADPAVDRSLWQWPPGPRSHLPPQRSYLSLAFVHTASLVQILTEVTRILWTQGNKAMLIESGTIQRLNEMLDSWRDGLPPPLVVDPTAGDPALPHILMLNLTWHWIVMLLFHPFSQVTSTTSQNIGTVAMTRCYQAATAVVQLATLWRDQHDLRFTPPTMTAIIYSAGTSFVLAAAQAALPAQSAAAIQGVHSCLRILTEVGQTWEAGMQQAAVLQDLLDECSVELPSFMDDANPQWQQAPDVGRAPNVETQNANPQAGTSNDQALQSQSLAWTDKSVDQFDQFIQSLLTQSTMPIAPMGDVTGLFEGLL